jgi:hypothetical protein
MTDEQMADFLCLDGPDRLKLVAALPAEKRAVFERMAEVEVEVNLYAAGLGPKPAGVLLDFDRKAFR